MTESDLVIENIERFPFQPYSSSADTVKAQYLSFSWSFQVILYSFYLIWRSATTPNQNKEGFSFHSSLDKSFIIVLWKDFFVPEKSSELSSTVFISNTQTNFAFGSTLYTNSAKNSSKCWLSLTFLKFLEMYDSTSGFIRSILYHWINNRNNCKQSSTEKKFFSRYKLRKSVLSSSDMFAFGDFINFDESSWTSSLTSTNPSKCSESTLEKKTSVITKFV